MIISKLKPNGHVETIALGASHIIVRSDLCDSWAVVFEANGLDAKGNPLTYRLAMSRNELHTLQQFAALTKAAQ